MEKAIVVLLSSLVFFGLFFYCHFFLRFRGTVACTAMSIRYRYWQMWVVFALLVVGTLLVNSDFFWVGMSAGLSASALYYGGRFGVLRLFSFIALVGVFAWGIALGSDLEFPFEMAVAGAVCSFVVDLTWNRELKKRNLPPTDLD